MLFVRSILVLLSLNLIVSQCGLNVYALYCCCSKSLAYSVIPKEDKCDAGQKKNCHSHKTSAHGIHKSPCKNQLVERLSLESKAQKPNEDVLHAYDFIASPPDAFPLIAVENVHKSAVPNFHLTYHLSSQERLKRYCIRLC